MFFPLQASTLSWAFPRLLRLDSWGKITFFHAHNGEFYGKGTRLLLTFFLSTTTSWSIIGSLRYTADAFKKHKNNKNINARAGEQTFLCILCFFFHLSAMKDFKGKWKSFVFSSFFLLFYFYDTIAKEFSLFLEFLWNLCRTKKKNLFQLFLFLFLRSFEKNNPSVSVLTFLITSETWWFFTLNVSARCWLNVIKTIIN